MTRYIGVPTTVISAEIYKHTRIMFFNYAHIIYAWIKNIYFGFGTYYRNINLTSQESDKIGICLYCCTNNVVSSRVYRK